MPADDCDPASQPEVYGDAARILSDVLAWSMPSERWAYIGQVIDALATAVAAGNAAALTSAVADLELLSPLRITRIGQQADDQDVPPPDPVRDRVNRLIDALGQPSQQNSQSRGTTP